MNLTLIIENNRDFADKRKIESFVKFLFEKTGTDSKKELNILLCNDERIKEMNRRFRKKETATNVLSFYGYDGNILGDIAISLDTVDKEAEKNNTDKVKYLLFIVAHGFLHLLGYTHDTTEEFEKLVTLQDKLVNEFLERGDKNEKDSN